MPAASPRDGNLRLTSTADGDPLRFFLPDGAVEVLRRVGYDLFDDVLRVQRGNIPGG